jgi:hypothetical protein
MWFRRIAVALGSLLVASCGLVINLDEDLDELVRRGGLSSLKGIGDALEKRSPSW